MNQKNNVNEVKTHTQRNEQEMREYLFKYYKSKQYFLDMSLFKRHLEYFLDSSLLDYHAYNKSLNKVGIDFSFETVDGFIVDVSCCFDVYSDRYVFRGFEMMMSEEMNNKQAYQKEKELKLA